MILPWWSRTWLALDLEAAVGGRWASVAFDVGGYALGETAAVLIEWQYLRALGVRRAFAASCITNGASVSAGLALQALAHFG